MIARTGPTSIWPAVLFVGAGVVVGLGAGLGKGKMARPPGGG